MKYVKLDDVLNELKFQKKEMLKRLSKCENVQDVIDIAEGFFENAIHGVEEHLEQKEFE